MRRLLLSLAAAMALPVLAQDAAPRFAFFIPDQVMQNSVRAKKVMAELEVLNKTLSDKLRAKAESLQASEQQLKSPGLSEAGRAKLQKDLQEGEGAFKRLQEDSQLEFRKAQDRVFGQFQQEIKPILDELAREQKLHVIFQYQQGMVIPVDEKWLLSFSLELARRYDAKFEGPGAKPAPEKPAAKPALKRK